MALRAVNTADSVDDALKVPRPGGVVDLRWELDHGVVGTRSGALRVSCSISLCLDRAGVAPSLCFAFGLFWVHGREYEDKLSEESQDAK